MVLACSALRKSYRDFLKSPDYLLKLIYLKISKQELTKRLENRVHFASVGILASQLRDLEEPSSSEECYAIEEFNIDSIQSEFKLF